MSRNMKIFLLVLLAGLMGQSSPMARAAGKAKSVEIALYLLYLGDVSIRGGTYRTIFWATFLSEDNTFDPEAAVEIVEARSYRALARSETALEDGRVAKSIKYEATINQNFDLQHYPLDAQVLNLSFEPVNSQSEKLGLVLARHNVTLDPQLSIVGWHITGVDASNAMMTYPVIITERIQKSATYSRASAAITVKRNGTRDLVSDFLGFYVSKVLSATVLFVEVFEPSRASIPVVGRLSLLVGSLFGSVGNANMLDGILPSQSRFSMPDLIELSTFADIGLVLAAVIGSETLGTLGLQGARTVFVGTAVAVYAAMQAAFAVMLMME